MNDWEGWLAHGRRHLAEGRPAEAHACLSRAAALRPDDASINAELARSLYSVGRAEEAIPLYRDLLARQPDDPSLAIDLGRALRATGAYEAAIEAYQRVLMLLPGEAAALNNIGNCQLALGLTEAAIGSLRQAVLANPEFVDAHHNLALALLTTGQMREGWEEYRWRSRLPAHWIDGKPIEEWDGTPMPGKRLFVRPEQGLGDTIQFCRYVTLIAPRARVILGVPRPLFRLLRQLPNVERVITEGDADPARDAECIMLSLPRLLAAHRPEDGGPVPYLRADPTAVAAWRIRLEPLPGPKVGLVWAGSPGSRVDRWRSIPLAAFASLHGATFISLQQGPAAAQARQPPSGMALLDWSGELHDFADTAALIMALDLVISVDTAVAHLAGALGRPVWLLNRTDTDWRWRGSGETTPWYPTMRIFRQTSQGDWTAPIAAIATALISLATEQLFDQANDRHRRKDYAAAADGFRQVLALNPNHPGALGNLAMTMLTLRRPELAVHYATQAVGVTPDSQPLRMRLGLALHAHGRFEEAVARLREARAMQPGDTDTLVALGNALGATGALDAAIATLREAVAARPDNPGYHINLGYALLRAGQWREGWREHEYRSERPRVANIWRGQLLPAAPLLLRHEQGAGDIIQFCRFAVLAAERAGGETMLTVPRPLRDLLGSLRGVSILSDGSPLPANAYQFPLLSLPMLFDTTLETLPAKVPYLHADPAKLARWLQRVVTLPGLRVGLAWAGNPRLGAVSLGATDRRRSLPEGTLAPLEQMPGVTFVSLQVGDAVAPGVTITDWTNELSDFAETGALIATLDLVISVDTAAAHLAGALGRPVWLLNRFDTDWRWMDNRDDSPWYPTLRLFRQELPGDWAGVIERLRRALAGFQRSCG